MTFDPWEMYQAELAARQRWRPTPWEYIFSMVSGLPLSPSAQALYPKLFGVCDDGGAFPADNTPLAIRLKQPTSRPRRALERLMAFDLVELYEADGMRWGRIKHFSEMVGLQREARPIYPQPQGGVHSAAKGGSAPAVSPPTPPSSLEPQEGRAKTKPGARLELLKGETRMPRAAYAASAADAVEGPERQIPLEVEPELLPKGLERIVQQFIALHASLSPHLPTEARRLPISIVRDEVRDLHLKYTRRPLCEAMRRLKREGKRPEALKWWGKPLDNLARKTLFAWQDMGGALGEEGEDDTSEESADQGVDQVVEADVVTVVECTKSAELDATWKQLSALMHARMMAWDYKHWWMPLQVAGVSAEGNAIIGVPDESHAETMREQFWDLFTECITELGLELDVVLVPYNALRSK